MVILKQGNKGKLEIFEVSESVLSDEELQKYKVFSADKGEDGSKEAIDIYKMEYERCAQRYNDLYNAAWTNFSYMALVAGGILSFGGSRFVTPFTAFLACLPLLFWWLATFEPLNRYGDLVETQILKIEKALNALSISRLTNVPDDAKKGLTHFEDFAKRGGVQKPTKIECLILVSAFVVLLLFAMNTFLGLQNRVLSAGAAALLVISILIELKVKDRRRYGITLARREYPRVRFRVRFAACVVLIVAVCFGVRVGQLLRQSQSLTVPISSATDH
jgi:hypothetical protein